VVALRRSWVLVPMVLHAGYCVWHGRQSDNRIEGFEQAGWYSEPLILRLDHLMEFALHAWSPVAEWVGWAALGLSVAAAVIGRPEGRAGRRWVLVSTGIGLVLYLSLPLHMPGWAFLSPRVLPPIVLATFLLIPVSSRTWNALISALLALSLVSAVVSLKRMQQLGHQLDLMVGPPPASAPGSVYAAIFGVDLQRFAPPYVRAASSVGFYPMLMGGWGPSAFAHYPTAHTMMFVRPLGEVFPSNQAWTEISIACLDDPTCFQPLARADRIAVEALPWSTLLLANAPDAVRQRLQLRGYQPWTSTLVRPRPTAVTIELHDPGIDMERSILLRWRWPDTGIVVAGAARSGARRVSGQVYRVQWSLPAGPAELVAAIDMDDNGALDAADDVFFRADVTVEPGAALTFPVQRAATP
jgi:hypothetical protein